MINLEINRFKSLLLFSISIVLSFNTYAQAPESMNYQAVIRDGSGDLVASQSVGIRIKILQGNASGTNVYEETFENKLDLKFDIQETEKYFVEKINIYGNNITRESVIRNNLEIDEGDPFNNILQLKSENNLKSLNFFKSVSSEVLEGNNKNSKIINIKVEEKPTGEISLGAGVGTSGGSIGGE